MKRVVFFFLTLLISSSGLAFAPTQYALQVLQKDLPQSLRWFGKIAQSQQLSQVEVYGLYQSALPETQGNQQAGISTKGSVERMILLLEGARYFEQIQNASADYQNKKEATLRILQASKDQMDRFQYGEDPQVLLEEWRALGIGDFGKLMGDLVEVFTETQTLLNSPVISVVEERVDAEVLSEEDSVAAVAEESFESFESQRLHSYLQSAEAGQVAGECQDAQIWQTDQAESCQSDDSIECDRSYARQCKKLQ